MITLSKNLCVLAAVVKGYGDKPAEAEFKGVDSPINTFDPGN